MYRYQVHAQVRMAHWKDFQAIYERLNALAEAKGLVPSQIWEVAFGPLNGAQLITEYDSLEAYEREQRLLHADPAYLDLWREMASHLEGIPWTDLWWRPSGAI